MAVFLRVWPFRQSYDFGKLSCYELFQCTLFQAREDCSLPANQMPLPLTLHLLPANHALTSHRWQAEHLWCLVRRSRSVHATSIFGNLDCCKGCAILSSHIQVREFFHCKASRRLVSLSGYWKLFRSLYSVLRVRQTTVSFTFTVSVLWNSRIILCVGFLKTICVDSLSKA